MSIHSQIRLKKLSNCSKVSHSFQSQQLSVTNKSHNLQWPGVPFHTKHSFPEQALNSIFPSNFKHKVTLNPGFTASIVETLDSPEDKLRLHTADRLPPVSPLTFFGPQGTLVCRDSLYEILFHLSYDPKMRQIGIKYRGPPHSKILVHHTVSEIQYLSLSDVNLCVAAHKCPICEKCFAMKSSLKIHLLTHTKVR